MSRPQIPGSPPAQASTAFVLNMPLALALPVFFGLVTLSIGALVVGVLEERLLCTRSPLDGVTIAAEIASAWWLVVAGAILSALCGLVLGWAIVRPLRQLARELATMADRGRSTPLSLGGAPELAGLGEAYNRLVMSTSRYLPQRARYIFHHLASGVMAYDADGRLVTLNAAADAMLELGGCNVTGRRLRDVLGAVGAMEPLIDVLEEPLRRPGSAVSREAAILTASGVRKTLGVTVASVPAPHPEGGQDIVATLMDLSRLREISQHMLQAEKLAAVGSLAAGVAHEIRNPLASMRALAQMLCENEGPNAQQQEYLRVIVSEVDRLNEVVSRLLDFASPRPEPQTELNLSDLLADAIQLASAQFRAKDIRVDCRFAANVKVLGRRRQLLQAFLNVLVNGAEAAPQQGRVEITLRDGNPIELWITNDGPPIAEHERRRIFDPYHTTKETGTGLGLAITEQIIAQHGGTIQVADRPGGGAAFVIRLPPCSGVFALAGTQTHDSSLVRVEEQ